MRLIHTSDWHIGRYLHGYSLLDEQAHVLNQLCQLVETHQPEVLLVSGDLFDRPVPAADAVGLMDQVLDTLIHTHKVQVVAISGNHDSAKRLEFGRSMFESSGLHLFTKLEQLFNPVVIQDTAFYAVPYADPETVRFFVAAGLEARPEKFKDCAKLPIQTHEQAWAVLSALIKEDAALSGYAQTVVLAHAYVSGGAGSDSERPLSIGGSELISTAHFEAFDYVALGHLHQMQQLGSQIRYSGSPLKYSFSEDTHNKGVLLVDLAPNQAPHIQRLALTPKHELRRIKGSFNQILADAKAAPSQDYLQIELSDQGAVIDPVARLKPYYPNLLNLTRRPLQPTQPGSESAKQPTAESVKTESTLDLFADFVEQMRGSALSTEEAELVASIKANHLEQT